MEITKKEDLHCYERFLIEKEKSPLTQKKYIRDVFAFMEWLGFTSINKIKVLEYKEYLMQKYTLSSVNSIISSLNNYFLYLNRNDLKIKTIKQQKNIFLSDDKELTKQDYFLLITEAERNGNTRLSLVMQTICSTGIRVSELKFVTVEAIQSGIAEINCKGKKRNAFLPNLLCLKLKKYTLYKNIRSGPIFITKNGKPLDRSNIWVDMKKMCKSTNVLDTKVFPHNLRHLFARTYYSSYKDIVKLADILGHSNVNTTRIYTAETGAIHREQLQNLGLVSDDIT